MRRQRDLTFSRPTKERLSGVVDRVVYHNPENGWTVLKVHPLSPPPPSTLNSKSKLVTALVYQAKVFAGATMDFFGSWSHNPKYGDQFVAERALEKKPASCAAIEKYLGSGLIKGVGPITAQKIVSFFKEKTLNVFEEQIDCLTQVPGIGGKKLKSIQRSWEEHKSIRDVMIFLQEYGVSTLFAVKIFKFYGPQAISLVSEDPYRLARDIYGIGFFSSDRIALKMGLAKNSPKRLRAGIQHVLASSQEEGHCYLLEDQIVKNVQALLEEEEMSSVILSSLKELVKENQIKTRILKKAFQSILAYYSPSLYFFESNVAEKAKGYLARAIPFKLYLREEIQTLSKKHELPLSEEQKHAILGILNSSFSLLTGGPGCGKTTTTRLLVELLYKKGKEVILAAPTGRAAQRMSEVMKGRFKAKTLHRMLKWSPRTGGFEKNEKNPLEGDFLIVDECSMLDVFLMSSLLDAVSFSMQVLLVGDSDQLPSIGAGNVLRNFIDSKVFPCFQLKQIFRQSERSQIVSFSHEINHGHTPSILSPLAFPEAFKTGHDCLFIDSEEMSNEQKDFIKKFKRDFQPQTPSSFSLPEKFQHVNLDRLLEAKTEAQTLKTLLPSLPPHSALHHNLTAKESLLRLYTKSVPRWLGQEVEVQILSPQVRGSLGTHNLNLMIQNAINPIEKGKAFLRLGERRLIEGDRVIQTRNNYDLNVFNGDIGFISFIDTEERKVYVNFEIKKSQRNNEQRNSQEVVYEEQDILDLGLAYAITIHKSQGSEFDVVLIPITFQHFNMLYRNLIYTGLTRGKKLVVFVGSRKALAASVHRLQNEKRQTALKDLLMTT